MTTPVTIAVMIVALATAARLQPRRTRFLGPATADRPPIPPATRGWRSTPRRRQRPPSPTAVAAWCDDLSRRVRAGSTLRDALQHVRPADRATEAATRSLRLALERGRATGEAITGLGDRGPHLRLALQVIAAIATIGGSSAAAIDRTAAALRQRAADVDERGVQAAQAQLSAHVLTAVPLLMLGLLLATDPDVRHVASGPVGALCIGAGLVLNAIGWLWMRRVVGAGS
ncbi:MAG: type II secretion system F family protein [Ilumatobacteraceae bacterium]